MTVDCVVFRCSKQEEMYLYLRTDVKTATLPAPLLLRAGRLTEVMRLQLTPARKLARVPVASVIAHLQAEGWYLQLPPDGHMHGHLDDGD